MIRSEWQRPGVRGKLRECPVCGARQVRWTLCGEGSRSPFSALLCRCGASSRLPAAPRDQTTEAVERARQAMTKTA